MIFFACDRGAATSAATFGENCLNSEHFFFVDLKQSLIAFSIIFTIMAIKDVKRSFVSLSSVVFIKWIDFGKLCSILLAPTGALIVMMC